MRTFLGYDHYLIEEQNAEMPNGINDVEGDGHSRVQSFTSFSSSKNVSDQNSFTENKMEKYLHDVDHELSEILKLNNVPVIICGVKKEIANFKTITKNNNSIIGSVEGNFDYASPTEILDKIEPVFKKNLKTKEDKILKSLDEAISKKTYSIGIKEVWKTAMEKNGRILIVEKDYRCPAKLGLDEYSLIPLKTIEDKIEVINDAVDDIIEIVLKNGGMVDFVENGALSDFQRIALVTYYPV